MKNVFHVWLSKLKGKPDVSVKLHRLQSGRMVDNEYDGTIIEIEDELCLFKEDRDKTRLFKVKDIYEINGDDSLFKFKSYKTSGNHPFSEWLKTLMNKDVRIVTFCADYNGKIIRVEKDLGFVYTQREEIVIFRIQDVVEVSGAIGAFKVKTKVAIEEIK